MSCKSFFISGIDTDVGKSYATAGLLKYLTGCGVNAGSFKLVQTGSANNESEDLIRHRNLARLPMLQGMHRNLAGDIFTYPASPHLAAKLDNREIDFARIAACIAKAEKEYDYLLIEGAGGLMVPLDQETLSIDYACRMKWPLIIVTSGKLGSINHTLLSIEAAKSRGMLLAGVIFNLYPEENKIIRDDTKDFIQQKLKQISPESGFSTIGVHRNGEFTGGLDFSAIFGKLNKV